MDYNMLICLLEKFVNEKKSQASFLYKEDALIINKMLDQKYEHTKRVVLSIINIAEELNMPLSFQYMAMASGLFHDIGRFRQALIYKTYNDYLSFDSNKDHGDYGYKLVNEGFEEKYIFNEVVNKKERPSVATTIKYHGKTVLPNDYSYQINDMSKIRNINHIITGSYNFNYYEKLIISVLLHMVRDADRIDILWQRATGEIAPFNEIFYLNNNGNINDISKRWGVNINTIYEYNDKNKMDGLIQLKIPRKEIPIEKLFVDEALKTKIKNFERIDLRSIQKDDNYTPITALWWSLYTFLKDMNFIGNLKQVKEKGLLDSIYNQYPSEYRPLIDEIFTFANEILINEQLENNKDEIYVKKRLV